jgi:fatty acid-binding protein DegV
MAETQKEKLMRLLDLTAEQAEQLMADDKAIEKGEPMPFDLTEEQKKVAKKMTNTVAKIAPTRYKFDQRKTTKENTTKGNIIAEIAEFLKEKGYEDIEIVNKERQFTFKYEENTFEITLIQKRKGKT